MVANTPPRDWPERVDAIWDDMLRAFKYQNATLSRADLLTQHERLGASRDEIAKAIDWARAQQLIEDAEETGSLRLTPQGRRAWRATTGEA